MKHALVIDSHARLTRFEDQEGKDEVVAILRAASAGRHRLLMSVVNWGEVLYVAESRDGKEGLRAVVLAMEAMPIELLDVDRDLTATAARFKARGGIAYADCFAAALAHREEAAVVTGDPEFERVESEVEILWVARAAT